MQQGRSEAPTTGWRQHDSISRARQHTLQWTEDCQPCWFCEGGRWKGIEERGVATKRNKVRSGDIEILTLYRKGLGIFPRYKWPCLVLGATGSAGLGNSQHWLPPISLLRVVSPLVSLFLPLREKMIVAANHLRSRETKAALSLTLKVLCGFSPSLETHNSIWLPVTFPKMIRIHTSCCLT